MPFPYVALCASAICFQGCEKGRHPFLTGQPGKRISCLGNLAKPEDSALLGFSPLRQSSPMGFSRALLKGEVCACRRVSTSSLCLAVSARVPAPSGLTREGWSGASGAGDAALRLRCSKLRRAEAEDSVLAGSKRGCERSLPATVGIPRLSELMPGVQVQYSCYSGHGLSGQGRSQGRSEAQLPNWLTQRFFVYTLPRKKAAWLSCFAAGVPNCRQS